MMIAVSQSCVLTPYALLTVSSEYFCNLDANLMRLDQPQRPELNKGTVDFTVPEQYWATDPPPKIKPLYQPVAPLPESEKRKPLPLDYVFAIEVTADAVCSGFTSKACESLSRALFGDDTTEPPVPPCISHHSRICIVTFDQTVHFYDLSVSRLTPLSVNGLTGFLILIVRFRPGIHACRG